MGVLHSFENITCGFKKKKNRSSARRPDRFLLPRYILVRLSLSLHDTVAPPSRPSRMRFEQAGEDALVPFPGELYSGNEFRYKRDKVGAALVRGLELRSDPASGLWMLLRRRRRMRGRIRTSCSVWIKKHTPSAVAHSFSGTKQKKLKTKLLSCN